MSSCGRGAPPRALGHRQGVGVGAQVHDQVGPDIAGQQDQRVLEVDPPALAVVHHALVEDLEEDLVHVGMRLLDLVQQHDAVGLAPHRLGQPAALAVADIARRRALQRRDRVRLLELRHVDRDQVLLAAVERVGQRQRGLRLADAARAAQQEHADRLGRVLEPGARGLDAAGDHLERVVLADDPPLQRAPPARAPPRSRSSPSGRRGCRSSSAITVATAVSSTSSRPWRGRPAARRARAGSSAIALSVRLIAAPCRRVAIPSSPTSRAQSSCSLAQRSCGARRAAAQLHGSPRSISSRRRAACRAGQPLLRRAVQLRLGNLDVPRRCPPARPGSRLGSRPPGHRRCRAR